MAEVHGDNNGLKVKLIKHNSGGHCPGEDVIPEEGWTSR